MLGAVSGAQGDGHWGHFLWIRSRLVCFWDLGDASNKPSKSKDGERRKHLRRLRLSKHSGCSEDPGSGLGVPHCGSARADLAERTGT